MGGATPLRAGVGRGNALRVSGRDQGPEGGSGWGQSPEGGSGRGKLGWGRLQRLKTALLLSFVSAWVTITTDPVSEGSMMETLSAKSERKGLRRQNSRSLSKLLPVVFKLSGFSFCSWIWDCFQRQHSLTTEFNFNTFPSGLLTCTIDRCNVLGEITLLKLFAVRNICFLKMIAPVVFSRKLYLFNLAVTLCLKFLIDLALKKKKSQPIWRLSSVCLGYLKIFTPHRGNFQSKGH